MIRMVEVYSCKSWSRILCDSLMLKSSIPCRQEVPEASQLRIPRKAYERAPLVAMTTP